MELPKDIVQQIFRDFKEDDCFKVLKELTWRYEEKPDFWAESVIRSTIFLSKGKLERFYSWLDTDDWRTILIHADEKSGNYGHYFKLTFDEIEKLNAVMQKELQNSINEQIKLPPNFFEDDFEIK